MKWFLRILIVVLLLGGWIAAARSLHVVHSTDPSSGQDRFGLVPKSRWMFNQTYVDVRRWAAADLAANIGLVQHLVNAGKADLLKHVAPREFAGDLPAWLLETAAHPPTTTAPAAN